MTVEDNSEVPTDDGAEARIAQHHAQFAGAFAQNKEAVFTALAAAGITRVIASFDGSGDEGQIENVETKTGDTIVKLPDCTVPIVYAHWHEPEPARATDKLEEAIDKLVYDCFEQRCFGWDQGEGSYGDVTFDVAARTIRVDFNQRFIESENSEFVL